MLRQTKQLSKSSQLVVVLLKVATIYVPSLVEKSHLLDGISMVNSKPAIDHINILIKGQSISIALMSDNETHSEGHICV